MAGQRRILYSEQQIAERVDELARQISRDYRDADELVLVGILKGAFIFLADLTRKLTIPRSVDFVALASYDGSVSTGDVRLIMDLRAQIRDKHVLIVDDILDTGTTLAFLRDLLSAHRPASVRTCVLIRKRKPEQETIEPDYAGFDIDDVWVVGYGLDYADRDRTLPYIATR
ncbi:MAG: hypoxanthine phosphoribosyltransferase [bacterium]|nr:hypoxanthine phosphoribosyltransferase [bacterium]